MSRSLYQLMRPGITVGVLAALINGQAVGSESLATHNVILVTLDGVRTQEIFSGLDEVIAVHDEQDVYSEMVEMRERYGGPDPVARREALMPNFWQVLAPQGIVLGNATRGNHVKVQNKVLWSTPGYTEIMTGGPRVEVVDNDNVRHDHKTVLEYAREALALEFQQVAEIGGWDGFKFAAASRDDAFLMVGTYDDVPAPWSTPEIDLLNDLRKEVMGLWEEGSNDALTYRMAHAYLQKNQPRVMWLALVNSDDWAHADRYDRYLQYLHEVDSMLAGLWTALQSIEQYRDKTTLIVTTDHGRGLQGSDWAEHEITIPGSDDIWVAIVGPDTPDVGEVVEPGTAYQGQVAATLLQFLALDYREFDAAALPPFNGSLMD